MKQGNKLGRRLNRVFDSLGSQAIPLTILVSVICGALILWHIHGLVHELAGAEHATSVMVDTYYFVGMLVTLMSAAVVGVGLVLKQIINSRAIKMAELETLKNSLECAVINRTASLEREIAVRENLQARFVAAIEIMRDAFLISNEKGVIEFVNKTAEQMFGYPVGEMIGMSVDELLPKREQDFHARKMRRYRETGEAHIMGKGRDQGLSARRRDGSTFPVSLLIDKLKTEEGVFYTGIIADLTEKHEWITNSRRMMAVVENANDCIVVLGADGAIEYVNPQFEREFGYTAGELLGKQRDEMGWQRSTDEVNEAVTAAISQGEAWSGHMLSQSRCGDLLEHDCSFSPITREDRSVSGYVYIGRNVAETMEMQRQLNQAQKLESIGQLAAGIAHEINTPTQYVGDNTTFLQDAYTDLGTMIATIEELVAGHSESVPAKLLVKAMNDADVNYLKVEIPKAIEQSLEGVGRVSKIVRAMKEFSHPSQEKTMVDLNKAIESTITVASNEWKYVADMQMDLDAGLPPVQCLPGDVNQVVLNIIVNAAHAIADVLDESSGEKGAITVSTRYLNNWAEIRIEDTGSGMPEDVKSRIFDPFYTTKEVGKGTGQGLSIAHAVIVEKHAGTIAVDSTPGQGTAFTIRIPIEDTSPTEAAA